MGLLTHSQQQNRVHGEGSGGGRCDGSRWWKAGLLNNENLDERGVASVATYRPTSGAVKHAQEIDQR